MNSTELRNILGEIVTSTETGVFACDQLNFVEGDEFAIVVNSDESSQPGMHWL